jgi:cytoskeletal protein RodZ
MTVIDEEQQTVGHANGERASEGDVESKINPAPTVDLPGAFLKAMREKMALSQEDISKHLRITVRQLNFVETDQHLKFPAVVFFVGHIRSYAKFLQIDPEPLVAKFYAYYQKPETGIKVSTVQTACVVQEHRTISAQWCFWFCVAGGLLLLCLLSWILFFQSNGAVEVATSLTHATPLDTELAQLGAGSPASPEEPAVAAAVEVPNVLRGPHVSAAAPDMGSTLNNSDVHAPMDLRMPLEKAALAGVDRE